MVGATHDRRLQDLVVGGGAAAEAGAGDRHPFRNRRQQRDEGCPGFPTHVEVELRTEDPVAKLGERLVAEEENPVARPDQIDRPARWPGPCEGGADQNVGVKYDPVSSHRRAGTPAPPA